LLQELNHITEVETLILQRRYSKTHDKNNTKTFCLNYKLLTQHYTLPSVFVVSSPLKFQQMLYCPMNNDDELSRYK